MSEKLKIALWIVLGVVGAMLIFCLCVCIGCAVDGLTFGEEICSWFAGKQAVKAGADAVIGIANYPLA